MTLGLVLGLIPGKMTGSYPIRGGPIVVLIQTVRIIVVT